MIIDLNKPNNVIDRLARASWQNTTLVILAIFIVTAFIGYKIIAVDRITKLDRLIAQESTLISSYERRQARANQLPAYRDQLREMQNSFGALIKLLPRDFEIPKLILMISEKSISNGLDVDSFLPKPEQRQSFYAVKPIVLKVNGSYEQLAKFVSELSGLPRITNITDIRLSPNESSSNLTMQATIKTYRYLREDEVQYRQ